MKLICIKQQTAHWGSIFTPGKEYEIKEIVIRSVNIITDYDNYWYYTSLIASSIDWVRKGYTQKNLHEVIPGYKTMSERDRLYTRKIDIPYAVFLTDEGDGRTKSFCMLSKEELSSMGASKSKHNEIAFCYTEYLIDDYFDYKSIRRDKKLNDIGI